MQVRRSLRDEVEQAFAPGGPVATSLHGFESRPGQTRLAVAWAQAIEEGKVLVAEAATGIGKTLAYLVPVVLSGRRAIVSTGTKTLQKQLVEKDVPLVRAALSNPFSCVVLKGRGNYLCKRRWRHFAAEPTFEFSNEASHFERMRIFAETTRTGDISECDGVPEGIAAWGDVNARAEACDPQVCRETESCFLMEARRRAAAADLIVVNHHLFFADLSVRRKTAMSPSQRPVDDGPARSFAEVLPDAELVVFDEAHAVEETACAFFGSSVSSGRAREVSRDARKASSRWGGESGRAVIPAAEVFRRAAEGFFAIFSGESRFTLAPLLRRKDLVSARTDVESAARDLMFVLSEGAPSRDASADVVKEAGGLSRRVESFLADLSSVLSPVQENGVAWGERRNESVTLSVTPVEVSSLLAEALWARPSASLLTSATLSVSGGLDYFRRRAGLAFVDAPELVVDNEFDYAGRSLLYVPDVLPDPTDPAFPEAAAMEAERILTLSGGGALVLCTSWRVQKVMAAHLSKTLLVPVYSQGVASRDKLLRAFREDGDAVLVGTGTFWEGIDVPGEALRCVVIDKLPFAPPNDPVVDARLRAIRENGGDPFTEYQIPEAILALRQGVGRLLRRHDDYGVVALLDRRVVTKSYGSSFLGSLPAMPTTRELAEVDSFYRRHRRPRT